MFNNLLNTNSSATVIDSFENSQSEAIGNFEKFTSNLREYLPRIDIRKGYSRDELDKLEKESYDIVYIDGSHMAEDVYYDLMHTFPLVKPGGIVICDDYLWWLGDVMIHKLEVDCKPFHESQPMKAINRFIKERGNEILNITNPVLLEHDESISESCISSLDLKKLFGDDLTVLLRNPVNQPNYQFIFYKLYNKI